MRSSRGNFGRKKISNSQSAHPVNVLLHAKVSFNVKAGSIFLVFILVSCSSLDRGASPGTATPYPTAQVVQGLTVEPPTAKPPAEQILPSEPPGPFLPTMTNQPSNSTPVAAATLLQPSLTALSPPALAPDEFPDPTTAVWTPIAAGLEKPNGLASPRDGSGRLFILEQTGRIRILRDGLLEPQPFLDLSDRITSAGFEQGLLGLAFHPDYAQTGFFYVNYTNLNGDTVIARYQVSSQDPNQAERNSEVRLLQVDQPFAKSQWGRGSLWSGWLFISGSRRRWLCRRPAE